MEILIRLYLASLYLLPEFQRKGIGGRLLAAAEEKTLSYNLGELCVGVMVQNELARRWYEKRGFRFVRGSRSGWAGPPFLI